MRSPVHSGAYSGRAMPRDAVGSSGYLSLSEIHSFSFRTLRAGGGEGEWRGGWSARGSEAGDTTGSGRVLPRANDIVTITVTTYPSTEWWRVTACLDSAKPRGSKIHWSGGCDPAVSMLLGRYVWLATLQRTYHYPRPSSPVSISSPFPSSSLAHSNPPVHRRHPLSGRPPYGSARCLNTITLYGMSLRDVSACHL